MFWSSLATIVGASVLGNEVNIFYEKLLAGNGGITITDHTSNPPPSDFTFVFSPKSATSQLCYCHNPFGGWVGDSAKGWVGDGIDGEAKKQQKKNEKKKE